MKLISVLFIIFFFFLSSYSFSQQQSEIPSPEKMQEEMQKMQKRLEEEQKTYFERLKTESPVVYEEAMKDRELNGKISQIVSNFNQKAISREQAEQQLFPLVKESLKSRLGTIDSEIQRLENKLVNLKKVKQDPSVMVKSQINQLLGSMGSQQPSEIDLY